MARASANVKAVMRIVPDHPVEHRHGGNAWHLDITFRRDEETRRPRVNKPESNLDREQKKIGEYYYLPQAE